MNRKRATTSPVLIVIGGVALITIAVVLLAAGPVSDGPSGSTSVGASHYPAGSEGLRSVLVTAEERVSGPTGPVYVSMMSGAIPQQPTIATVLSDANCAPDGQGISHCINELRHTDGSMLQVRHLHRMADEPCLAPQERVLVEAAM